MPEGRDGLGEEKVNLRLTFGEPSVLLMVSEERE